MTLHRAPGSEGAVLLQALNILSPSEVEAATGKTPDHFYKVSRPGKSLGLHLKDAARLGAALIRRGQPDAFLTLYQDTVAGTLNGHRRSSGCIHKQMRRIGAETGDVFRAVEMAMEDGKLDLHERRAVAREAQEAIDALTALRDSMEPPSDGSEPLAFTSRRAAE